LFFIGRVHAVRGHLRQAAGVFNAIVGLQVRMPIIGLVYLDLSIVHDELNDLETSEQYLEQGIEIIGTKGHQEFQIAGLMQKARLMTAKGDQQIALQVLEKCSQISNSSDIPQRTQGRIASCIVETTLACGDLEQAVLWSEKAITGSDAHPFYRFLHLSHVRLLMAQRKMAEALEQIKALTDKASAAGWRYGLVYLHVLQTLSAPDMDTAVDFLAKALRIAHPEGFIRTFIDRGEELIPFLREAALRGKQSEYIGEILAAYTEQPAHPALPLGIEALSERELEVLHLLAAGLTNRQIAEQLIVSISTVKSHVHHISGKLDVSNRTQAVARARQLGLL
jgi:LuxR family maltose regulon positive regulatory protein